MTETQKEQELLAPQMKPAKSFAMTDADDLAEFMAEEEEHAHVHGCCSCHSNIGK